MIQLQSLVKITDNSGAKLDEYLMLGGSKRRYARLGDKVILSVQTAEPQERQEKTSSSSGRIFDD